MSTATNTTVIRRLFDAVNAHDLEASVELAADDIVVHTPIPGIPSGRDGFRGFMAAYFAAFPEQRVEVQHVVADGDLVAVLHVHHLVQGGEFAGLPPSGKRATIDGLELFRIAGGKIAEMWHHDDLLGLMQQLGAIPAPAGAPTR